MASPATNKSKLMDRISIFEKSGSSSAGTPTRTPPGKIQLTKTLSGKNFGAIKSQFDSPATPAGPPSQASSPKPSIPNESTPVAAKTSISSKPSAETTPPSRKTSAAAAEPLRAQWVFCPALIERLRVVSAPA